MMALLCGNAFSLFSINYKLIVPSSYCFYSAPPPFLSFIVVSFGTERIIKKKKTNFDNHKIVFHSRDGKFKKNSIWFFSISKNVSKIFHPLCVVFI